MTKESLVKELSERLNREFVGIDFNFSQYIQDNIEEAVSGVKGENSIKIFGRELQELERLARDVKTEISKVEGVRDAASFNLLGQPNLIMRIDRAVAARYGFSVSDINTVVQAAIGGQEVTRVYEGEMNFGLTVRLAPNWRSSVEAIRSIPVALPNPDSKGLPAYIALGDLGEVQAGIGCRLYLSREQPAFRAAEIQRARSRSRLDRGRSAGARRKERADSAGLQPGMVGRIRCAAGSQEASCLHRAAQPAAHPDAALQPVQFGARQSARLVRNSVRGRGRHPRTLCRRAACERVGGCRASSRCSACRRWTAFCWSPISARIWRRG